MPRAYESPFPSSSGAGHKGQFCHHTRRKLVDREPKMAEEKNQHNMLISCSIVKIRSPNSSLFIPFLCKEQSSREVNHASLKNQLPERKARCVACGRLVDIYATLPPFEERIVHNCNRRTRARISTAAIPWFEAPKGVGWDGRFVGLPCLKTSVSKC